MNWTAVFLGASALGAWLLLRDRKSSSEIPRLGAAQKTAIATTSVPEAPHLKISSVPAKVPTLNDSPSASAQYYVQHLENAARNMEIVHGGASTHDESIAVNEAWAALSAPIDVLTAQKDFNVLGATPPLTEDGVLGPKTRDAIDSFQRHLSLSTTGVMDPPTSHALRQAIVSSLAESQGARAS